MNKNEDGEYELKRREFKGERIKETMGIKEKKNSINQTADDNSKINDTTKSYLMIETKF